MFRDDVRSAALNNCAAGTRFAIIERRSGGAATGLASAANGSGAARVARTSTQAGWYQTGGSLNS